MVHVGKERHDLLPKLYPAIIHETIGVTNHLRIRAKLEAIQHDPAGLGHDAFRFGHGTVDVVDLGFDQQGVMHRIGASVWDCRVENRAKLAVTQIAVCGKIVVQLANRRNGRAAPSRKRWRTDDMETLQEYREWLVNKIKLLTDLSKPMTDADIPEDADIKEVDEEWDGPELTVYEDAAEIVREAGENALLFGLYNLYRVTRIRPTVSVRWPEPKLSVCEDAAHDASDNATDDAAEIVREAAGETARPLGLPDLRKATPTPSIEFALPMLNIEDAKELLGQCLAATNELIERGTPVAPAVATVPPALMPSQEEVAELALAKKRTTDENQALAMGLLANHPDWSLQRIADLIGVSRRTLYNWPRFKAAHRMVKAKDTQAIPKGFKTSDGTVEAYNSPGRCVGCHGIATQDHHGDEYCRDCYVKKLTEEQQEDDKRQRPSPLSSRLPMRNRA